MNQAVEPTLPTRFERFAAAVVLLLLGVTWPVADLLANNAEFFIARRSPNSEILLIGLALLFGIPLLGGLLASLPGRLGTWLGNLILVVAGTSLMLLYFRRLPLPWIVPTILSVAGGAALLVAFHRSSRARLFARYLTVSPVLLAGLVILATPTGALVTDTGTGIGDAADVAGPIPVVLIVFDEFPLASMIDEQGDLRSDQFPSFAGLAQDATWFRNAVTVEQQSEHSVPAILTGNIPSQSLTPFAGQYPFNLFTALQGTYEMHVNETITQLCPNALCESVAVSSTPVWRDISVVAGHVLLPEGLTADLPSISAGWGDFEAAVTDFDVVTVFREQLDADPRVPIQNLIDDIGPIGAKPPLYFLHAVVPHHPWQFLPSGQRYLLDQERAPGSASPGWGEDEWLVSQAMQRHLLQAQYADTELGRIVDSLAGSRDLRPGDDRGRRRSRNHGQTGSPPSTGHRRRHGGIDCRCPPVHQSTRTCRRSDRRSASRDHRYRSDDRRRGRCQSQLGAGWVIAVRTRTAAYRNNDHRSDGARSHSVRPARRSWRWQP